MVVEWTVVLVVAFTTPGGEIIIWHAVINAHLGLMILGL